MKNGIEMSKSNVLVAALTTIEPTDAERRRLTDLALCAQEQHAEAVRATAALREALDAYRQTVEVDLPEAMREAGQSEFKLLDNTPVKLKQALQAGQLSDYGDNPNLEGLAWVEDHDGAPLLRAVITVEFDAQDIDAAREVYDMIRQHPSANRMKQLNMRRCVLAATLKKWVRQLMDQSRDPPLELLRVHQLKWVQVGRTAPKTVPITGFVER